MELLVRGAEYEELPESYVLFICDYDPLKLRKYKYTVKKVLAEDNSYEYEDGAHTVFLSTVGTNEQEVPEALVTFLKFVGAELTDSEADYNDSFVRQLQNSVKRIKSNRDMEARYMVFREMMKTEYENGREEGRKEGIEEGIRDSVINIINYRFNISDNLKERIQGISDNEIITKLTIEAATAESIEDIESKLDALLSDQVM